jgi:hypothetical protein
MKNDTGIFDAMRLDKTTGQEHGTGRSGTPEAIHRDGYSIDPVSQAFCPHEWLDERGHVDIDLALKHPNHPANPELEDDTPLVD